MALHALEDLDDALDATRAFLLPVDRSRWLKLALVVFFTGGAGVNANVLQFNVPSTGGPPGDGIPAPFPPFEPPAVPELVVIATIVAVVLLVGLLFLAVGSIMEFVLIESLRQETVRVRRYWGERWRQGLRLFGFRLAIGLVVLGAAAVVIGLFVLPRLLGGPGPGGPLPGVAIVALVFLLPVAFLVGGLVGLVNGFTTVFVVPVMVLEDCGVLAGWRRLWSTITANPWQYLAYAVAGFLLSVVGGILTGIAVAVAVLLLLIPFGILGALGLLALTAVGPLGIGILIVVGLLFALAALGVAALAQVPVITYLRYYAVLVLGDIDPDLDLIPDRRAAIRRDSTEE